MVVSENYLEAIYKTMPIKLSGPETAEWLPVQQLVGCSRSFGIHAFSQPSSTLPSINTVSWGLIVLSDKDKDLTGSQNSSRNRNATFMLPDGVGTHLTCFTFN